MEALINKEQNPFATPDLLEKQSQVSRFHDVIPMSKMKKKVVIFGCGSIGSYAALAVMKMGFENITLLDYDLVENENIGTQFFMARDVGRMKHEALEENLWLMSNENINMVCKEHKFEYDKTKDYMALSEICHDAIVISAIDSMKAREWLFELAPSIGATHFIDGRMAIEFLDVYLVDLYTPEAVAKYKKTLFKDDDAIPMPCTNKSIGYTAMIAGGVIGKLVKDVAVKRNFEGYVNFKFDINLLGGECL